MSEKVKPVDFADVLTRGVRLEELRLKGPEDPEDKRLRRARNSSYSWSKTC
jgi:hypothetical protein